MKVDPSSFAQLRVMPGTELIPLDEHSVLLRSFSGTLLLSGTFAAVELAKMLGEVGLDAPLSVMKARLGALHSADFDIFVDLLSDKHLLTALDANARPLDHDAAYWQTQGRNATLVKDALATASVAVVGLGSTGMTLAGALAEGGIGELILVDAERHASGEARAESAATALAPQGANTRAIVGAVDDLGDWEKLVAGVDAVVLCSDGMSLAGYDRTNELCLKHGTHWTSARIDRSRGLIGPYVVPHQTACFSCFELRSRSNADHPSDHEATMRHWKQPRTAPADWPGASEFGHLLGSAVALDLRRVLAGGTVSSAFGRMLEINFQTLETRSHEILKLPRCPVCSRTRERPLTRIWDLAVGTASRSASAPKH